MPVRPWRSPLTPLVVATAASQSLLVVLSPTIAAVGAELEASVGAVGQARSITAGVAIATSVALTARIEQVDVRRVVRVGAVLALAGSAAVAAAPTLAAFLAAHVVIGGAFACLLTAGFAGLAAFPRDRRSEAVGYVTGANAIAWIAVTPSVGALTDWLSWRVAHAVPAAIALAALGAAGAAVSRPSGSTPPPERPPRMRTVLATPSARRWIAAELMAYVAWTALLTFMGAYFIVGLDLTEATTGWLLAAGAAAYFAASTRSARLARHFPRRNLVAASALTMAVLLVWQFQATSAAMAATFFCLTGLAAGVRTPASSGLGLDQLPDHPGAMMAARTAATQLGYLLGAMIGGAVITGVGFGALGMVLAAGMVASGALILRVDDPAGPAPPARAAG